MRFQCPIPEQIDQASIRAPVTNNRNQLHAHYDKQPD
jgi:hypothetical protein